MRTASPLKPNGKNETAFFNQNYINELIKSDNLSNLSYFSGTK